MNKYNIIEGLQKKLEVLADATGTLRCGLIWDMRGGLQALLDEMKQEDEANARKVEQLKAMEVAK